MSLILRSTLRQFWGIKLRLGLVMLALAAAFAMPAGIELGLRSLLHTRDSFLGELALADLEVRLLPEDRRNLPSWADIPGIAAVETRLMLPGVLERPGRPPLNAVMAFVASDAPRVNRLRLLKGQGLDAQDLDGAVIERSTAAHHGVETGQRLRIHVGRQVFEPEVRGIVASPEFLIVAANPEYFLPEKGSLGIVYAPLSRIYESLGFELVNSVCFKLQPGADVDVVRRAVLAALGDRRLERVLTRTEQLSYRHIAIDHEVFRIFQPAIGLVLAALAVALVIINVGRLVRSHRPEIGALLAMGAERQRLVASYVAALLLVLAASLPFGVLGAVALRDNFLDVYAEAHDLAAVERLLSPGVLIVHTVTVALVVALAGLVATRELWSAVPLSMMRSAPARVAPSAPGLTSWLPLGVRLGGRNLLRDRRLLLLTTAGTTLTVAVALAYLICLDSMSGVMRASFASERWSRAVSFLHPVLDEDYLSLERLPGVANVAPFLRSHAQLSGPRGVMDVSLLGLGGDGSLRAARYRRGRSAESEREIVLGEDVCRRLGVDVGGSVDILIRNVRRPATVVGVKSDVLMGEAFVPLAAAQRWTETEDQATGVFLQAAPGADLPRLDAALWSFDFVGRVTPREMLVADFEKILRDIRKLVRLVANIALGGTALFVIANMGMTVSERAGEFASLLALGARRRVAVLAALTEVLGQTLVSLVVSVPLAVGLASLLNHLAGRAWFSQPTVVSAPVLLGVAGTVLVLMFLGAVPATWTLFRLDVARTIRLKTIQ